MRLMTTRITEEKTVYDCCRMVSFLFSQELTKKTLFILFAAGLLTWIVVLSGTSHTSSVDVFVYCLVYSSWITICLPWLVQNMTGKLLALIAGVMVRLFAVDVGVLAWSAVRGHRHIFQRGLRMKPLFEPSMSWLAEAGYNLRYGVVIAAIVASVVSLLLDLFEKTNQSMGVHFQRSAFFKRRNSWLLPPTDNPWEESLATKKPRYEEWREVHHRDIKSGKIGNTVRFYNAGGTKFMGSMGIQRRGERESQRGGRTLNATASGSDADSEGYNDRFQKRSPVDLYGGNMRSPRASWKMANSGHASFLDSFCKKSELSSLDSLINNVGITDEDSPRVFRVGLKDRSPNMAARVKHKSGGIRARSATHVDGMSAKTCCGSMDNRYVTRSYRHGKSNDSNEMKRRDAKEVVQDTLNESLLSLRKLRR